MNAARCLVQACGCLSDICGIDRDSSDDGTSAPPGQAHVAVATAAAEGAAKSGLPVVLTNVCALAVHLLWSKATAVGAAAAAPQLRLSSGLADSGVLEAVLSYEREAIPSPLLTKLLVFAIRALTTICSANVDAITAVSPSKHDSDGQGSNARDGIVPVLAASLRYSRLCRDVAIANAAATGSGNLKRVRPGGPVVAAASNVGATRTARAAEAPGPTVTAARHGDPSHQSERRRRHGDSQSPAARADSDRLAAWLVTCHDDRLLGTALRALAVSVGRLRTRETASASASTPASARPPAKDAKKGKDAGGGKGAAAAGGPSGPGDVAICQRANVHACLCRDRVGPIIHHGAAVEAFHAITALAIEPGNAPASGHMHGATARGVCSCVVPERVHRAYQRALDPSPWRWPRRRRP